MVAVAGVMVVAAADATATVTEALLRSRIAPGEARARGLWVKIPARSDCSRSALRTGFRCCRPGAKVLALAGGLPRKNTTCGKRPKDRRTKLVPAVRKGALSPDLLTLVLLAAKKKAAGLESGGMIKSSGKRGRGQTAMRINGPFR